MLQAVQDLRTRAERSGRLKSTRQQKVVRSGSYVVIEPVSPEVVYVPVYESDVYGVWEYPDYPPQRWYPPRRRVPDGALAFGAAVIVGAALWASWDWNRRRVAVDPGRFNRFNRGARPAAVPVTTWQHDPSRRRGAPYRAPVLVNKFKPVAPVQGTSQVPGPGTRPGPIGRPPTGGPNTLAPPSIGGVPTRPQPAIPTKQGPLPNTVPLTKSPGTVPPPPLIKGPPGTVPPPPVTKGGPGTPTPLTKVGPATTTKPPPVIQKGPQIPRIGTPPPKVVSPPPSRTPSVVKTPPPPRTPPVVRTPPPPRPPPPRVAPPQKAPVTRPPPAAVQKPPVKAPAKAPPPQVPPKKTP